MNEANSLADLQESRLSVACSMQKGGQWCFNAWSSYSYTGARLGSSPSCLPPCAHTDHGHELIEVSPLKHALAIGQVGGVPEDGAGVDGAALQGWGSNRMMMGPR